MSREILKRLRRDVQRDNHLKSTELHRLLDVAAAASNLTIGAGILSVLEDAGQAFDADRMALLNLRATLSRLGELEVSHAP